MRKSHLQDDNSPFDGPVAGGRRRASDALAGAFIRTNFSHVDYGFMANTLAYAIRQAQIPIHEWHFRVLDRDFQGGKMAALVVIGANRGLRQRDLADILGIVHSAVVGLVDRFTEMGLVERRRASDRRAYELALTEAGEAKVAEFEELALAHDEALSALMTAEERELLLKLLTRIAETGPDVLLDPAPKGDSDGAVAKPTAGPGNLDVS